MKVVISLGLALWVAVFVGGSLFLSAGRLDIPFFWANSLVWISSIIVLGLNMDLDLMRERSRGGGTQGKLRQIFGLPALASHFIVAGLDIGRYHWSDSVPKGLQVVSIAGVAAGFGLLSWALYANRYFVKELRIQEERGHELVISGPYRYIRHPGYAGFTIIFLISGLALGSWLSFLLGVGIGLYFVWRTAIEDGFLHENLEGYTDYVEKVQYRLIPGLW